MQQLNSPPSVHAVSLLKNLKHANIVTLHDIIHTDRCLTLVFEYLVSSAQRVWCFEKVLTKHKYAVGRF